MTNFHEIFRKNITYYNIKKQQKSGLHSLSIKYNFGKTPNIRMIPPSLFRIDDKMVRVLV